MPRGGSNAHPPAIIDAIERLTRQGLSARQIAIDLQAEGISITRNGVIGIWGRNRQRFGLMRPDLAANRLGKGRTVRASVAVNQAVWGDGCAWPIGHPGQPGFMFCGAPRHVRASSYCEAHAAAARAPKPPPPEHGRHASGEGRPWKA